MLFLQYEGIKVEKTKSPLQKPDPDTLVFGRLFTDHMLEISWDAETGWGTPEISPFHNLSLPPAASALHYAIEVRPWAEFLSTSTLYLIFILINYIKFMVESTQQIQLTVRNSDFTIPRFNTVTYSLSKIDLG